MVSGLVIAFVLLMVDDCVGFFAVMAWCFGFDYRLDA